MRVPDLVKHPVVLVPSGLLLILVATVFTMLPDGQDVKQANLRTHAALTAPVTRRGDITFQLPGPTAAGTVNRDSAPALVMGFRYLDDAARLKGVNVGGGTSAPLGSEYILSSSTECVNWRHRANGWIAIGTLLVGIGALGAGVMRFLILEKARKVASQDGPK